MAISCSICSSKTLSLSRALYTGRTSTIKPVAATHANQEPHEKPVKPHLINVRKISDVRARNFRGKTSSVTISVMRSSIVFSSGSFSSEICRLSPVRTIVVAWLLFVYEGRLQKRNCRFPPSFLEEPTRSTRGTQPPCPNEAAKRHTKSLMYHTSRALFTINYETRMFRLLSPPNLIPSCSSTIRTAPLRPCPHK